MGVYIIAEAGVNHNGDFITACRLVDAAKASGADCVKFQTYKSENCISKYAEKAEYQKQNDTHEETQLDMVKKLELSFEDFQSLERYCKKVGIAFLSTPLIWRASHF